MYQKLEVSASCLESVFISSHSFHNSIKFAKGAYYNYCSLISDFKEESHLYLLGELFLLRYLLIIYVTELPVVFAVILTIFTYCKGAVWDLKLCLFCLYNLCSSLSNENVAY